MFDSFFARHILLLAAERNRLQHPKLLHSITMMLILIHQWRIHSQTRAFNVTKMSFKRMYWCPCSVMRSCVHRVLSVVLKLRRNEDAIIGGGLEIKDIFPPIC